jgi:hypothetical protein
MSKLSDHKGMRALLRVGLKRVFSNCFSEKMLPKRFDTLNSLQNKEEIAFTFAFIF